MSKSDQGFEDENLPSTRAIFSNHLQRATNPFCASLERGFLHRAANSSKQQR